MSVTIGTETRQSDNRYIRKAMAQPLLERDYEVELAVAWRDHDDDKAMHDLVMAYARLVVSAAGKIPSLWPSEWRPHPRRQYWPDASCQTL